MFVQTFAFLIAVMSVAVALPSLFKDQQIFENDVDYDFPFVPRPGWHARTPKDTNPLKTPVPYVVIHHSYIPAACSGDDCKQAMRSMQNFHMDDRGWFDIGYNFGVGSDGVAYEGRGWSVLGAHALHFNSVSIGICLIGDWTKKVPPEAQRNTAKAIIAAGIQLGYIQPDYKVLGHRQVRDTECPGDALYDDIQLWSHYSPYPSCAKDLLDLDEISNAVKDIIRGNATLTS